MQNHAWWLHSSIDFFCLPRLTSQWKRELRWWLIDWNRTLSRSKSRCGSWSASFFINRRSFKQWIVSIQWDWKNNGIDRLYLNLCGVMKSGFISISFSLPSSSFFSFFLLLSLFCFFFFSSFVSSFISSFSVFHFPLLLLLLLLPLLLPLLFLLLLILLLLLLSPSAGCVADAARGVAFRRDLLDGGFDDSLSAHGRHHRFPFLRRLRRSIWRHYGPVHQLRGKLRITFSSFYLSMKLIGGQ